MRWTEQDLEYYLRRGQPAPPPAMREEVFLEAVLKAARAAGWMAYHTYRSTKSAEGFPDVVLAPGPTIAGKGHPLYVCELKREDGQVTPAQQAWLTALAGCTSVVAEVWRPSMLEDIAARLRA